MASARSRSPTMPAHLGGAHSPGRTSAGTRSVSGARSGRRPGRATTRSWSGRSTRSASRRGPSPSGTPPATCATSSSTAAFTRARRRAMRRTLVLAALVTALPLTAAAQTKAITLPPDHAYGDLTPGPGAEVARRAAALEEGPHPELFRDLLCLVDAARGAGTITTPLGDESGDVARPRLPAALAVTLGELESARHVAGGLVQFARCDVSERLGGV